MVTFVVVQDLLYGVVFLSITVFVQLARVHSIEHILYGGVFMLGWVAGVPSVTGIQVQTLKGFMDTNSFGCK